MEQVNEMLQLLQPPPIPSQLSQLPGARWDVAGAAQSPKQMTTLEKTLALAQAAEVDPTDLDSEQTPPQAQGTEILQKNELRQDEEDECNEDTEPTCLSQWDMDYTQPVDEESDGGAIEACHNHQSGSDGPGSILSSMIEAESQHYHTGHQAEQEVRHIEQHGEHSDASATRDARVSTAGLLAFKSRTSKFGRSR